MAYKTAAIKLLKHLGRAGKNVAIGTAAGAISGSVVSSSEGSGAARRTGGIVGAVTGGVASLPFGKLAKATHKAGGVFARGLKATPGSTVGSILRGADKAAARGRVVFRRIGRRIVPIRVKS